MSEKILERIAISNFNYRSPSNCSLAITSVAFMPRSFLSLRMFVPTMGFKRWLILSAMSITS